ncbi:hypothetical protein NEOLEDRAFT_1130740 [Neolentinus lepideus HHB14362 ss-1]|uniref:Exonuclease V n=1 Tax=Neolentinus lepideus HHB14362 ss-1 TaxID=1314782 RepID=A0A165U5L7_9AGAM|nr:hypothetical protein NEOLEDRAFT_1130740 [Neolentinus lepideus HHB14362 ss-1]
MSDSEYEGLDFTTEDFNEIDAIVLAALGSEESRSATPLSDSTSIYWDSSFGSISDFPGVKDASRPDILVELEDHPAARSEAGSEPEPNSPFNRFRRKQILSVSDLVGPVWCEVQFDYGLRQRRSRKIETRPTTFVSAHGREIKVNTKLARKNDKVLKAGQFVHKVLEREVKPVEVEVYVTTAEERWALRLVNMLAAVESLMTLGFAREMPVFGIVHGRIVVGIIDELHREAKPRTPPPSAKKKDKSPYRKPALGKRLGGASETEKKKSLPQITSFFKSTHRERSNWAARPSTPTLVPLPKYVLHLSDSKTRRTMTLPSDDDALPSRLQLMLYHRLLLSLVSLSSPFDFSKLWSQLGVRPQARLSEKFLADTGLTLGEGSETEIVCLDDLTAAWFTATERLDVDTVDKHLKLMYRTRPAKDEAGSKRKWDNPKDADLQASWDDAADADLQKAIEASLKGEQEGVAGPSTLIAEQEGSDRPGLAWVAQNALLKSAHTDASDTPPSPPLEDESPGSHVFGVKYFEVDDTLLDDHLKKVLGWWYGKRPPEGVSLGHTNRCFSCEYSDDCEWREAKAQEALSKPAFGGAEERYF